MCEGSGCLTEFVALVLLSSVGLRGTPSVRSYFGETLLLCARGSVEIPVNSTCTYCCADNGGYGVCLPPSVFTTRGDRCTDDA